MLGKTLYSHPKTYFRKRSSDKMLVNKILFRHFLCLTVVFLLVGSIGLRIIPAQSTEAQFVCTELLGRPTDKSVTVHAITRSDIEAYFEYGRKTGVYNKRTKTKLYSGGVPIEAILEGLKPNTRYFYRMRYRLPGEAKFNERPEYTFYTQRAVGSTFSFTIQSDSHVYDKKGNHPLYEIALKNQLADTPDFMIDLGDTTGDDHDLNISSNEMDQLHLDQRQFFSTVAHSIPTFLALGNHEGEAGFYLNVTPPNNLAIYGTKARQKYFPNPFPNNFYSGNTVSEPHVGLPQNYYAWTWGDALFVVIDPYRHLQVDFKQTKDMWDWTLGETQYNWLKDTLEKSKARYKFVFAHHLLGQTRGGVKMADKFEWGGNNKNGVYEFSTKRPGWAKPIHQLFVDNKVTIYFQGHDHLYAKEELDGVIYQETPMPSDSTYKISQDNLSAYGGVTMDNSGHLRVTVSPNDVTVDYVKAFLPGDGSNRQVAHSYKVTSTK